MNNTKQQENAMISLTRTKNIAELMPKLKPSELSLFWYINSFMSDIRAYITKDSNVKQNYGAPIQVQNAFYDKKEAAQFKNDNIINLNPEFIFASGAIDNTNLTTKKANYRARQLAKSLASKGVLTKINSKVYKDLYMINPLYIYWGSTFGDVYITYCEATNTPLQSDDPFLNKVYVEYYNGQKTYPANPLVYKEIESMYDNSPDIQQESVQESEPEIIEGPTSYFSEYYYSKSSDQFNSPYHISYSYLKDQYDREQRGLDPHWLAPKVPYSLNLNV